MKKLLLKSVLLLCALVVGTNAWAAEEAVTFSDQGYTSGNSVDSYTGTNFSVAFTNAKYYSTGSAIRVYGGGTFTVSSPHTITAIALTFGSGDGSNAITTNVTTYSNGTWSGSANSVTFSVGGSSGNRRIAGITVTYTPAAKSDPTITFNNGSVKVGKTLDVSSLFTSNSTGAVTYSITAGGSYASIDGTTLTGVAEGNVTVKASQAATATYNAAEKSATITVNAAPALSSIAITTEPTKKAYKEGQTFDPTGMVVTATYADLSTDDVTALCTFTPSGALSTSDTKVTVSYTENEVIKTADQAITVTAQSTSITINTDYEWLGVNSGTNIAAGNLPKAIDNDGLTVTFGSDGSTKPRGDVGYIRIYNENAMTFTAPASHFIKSIVFTQASVSGTKWNETFDADEGTWDNSKKTWSCGDDNVEEVTLTCDGTKFISKIVVTLVPYTTITPGKTYTTLTSAKKLDFTNVTGLKAYIATAVAAGKVQMVQVKKVPVNTGLVLMATTPGSAVNVPVAFDGTSDDVTGNKMAGSATETTAIAENGGYILKDGVFQPATAGTLAAGKAYLNIAVSARELELSFDENDVTAISELTTTNCTNNTNEYFDLQGRKVAQPTKGLYIVNGKKVVIK